MRVTYRGCCLGGKVEAADVGGPVAVEHEGVGAQTLHNGNDMGQNIRPVTIFDVDTHNKFSQYIFNTFFVY